MNTVMAAAVYIPERYVSLRVCTHSANLSPPLSIKHLAAFLVNKFTTVYHPRVSPVSNEATRGSSVDPNFTSYLYRYRSAQIQGAVI